MSVSGITNSIAPAPQNGFAKSRLDLHNLQSALTSGDLAGAQKDFADFQSDLSSLIKAPPAPPSGLQQASADFKALQDDLNAGNLAAAQKDFSTILQDLRGASGHHKHHHHERQEGISSNAADSNSVEDSSPSDFPGNGLDFRAVMAAYAAFSKAGTGTSVNLTA